MPPDSPPTESPSYSAEQAQEIASAAAAAALAQRDEGAAVREAGRAAEEEAAAQGVELSDEQIKRIADKTISALEERGAFETPTEGEGTGAEGGSGEQAGGELPSEHVAPPPVPDEPPRRRTFAEKFLGK